MDYVVTLVAAREHAALPPGVIGAVREAVRGGPAITLAAGEAADIPVQERPDPARLAAAMGNAPIDAFSLPRAGRRKRLLVADMDGTMVAGETLDDLAAAAGVGEAVADITRRSMNGEIDFREALRARVAMLRGLPLATIARVAAGIALTPGARTLVATMRAHGARAVLVTGGFASFAEGVARSCGFDRVVANTLEHDGAALTGRAGEPIVGPDTKAEVLRGEAERLRLGPQDALAIGDGANDLGMLRAAGLAIGYRPKPVVAAAIANQVRHADLRAALFAQGYTLSELQE